MNVVKIEGKNFMSEHWSSWLKWRRLLQLVTADNNNNDLNDSRQSVTILNKEQFFQKTTLTSYLWRHMNFSLRENVRIFIRLAIGSEFAKPLQRQFNGKWQRCKCDYGCDCDSTTEAKLRTEDQLLSSTLLQLWFNNSHIIIANLHASQS